MSMNFVVNVLSSNKNTSLKETVMNFIIRVFIRNKSTIWIEDDYLNMMVDITFQNISILISYKNVLT